MNEVDDILKSILGARREAKVAEMKALEEKIEKKIRAMKPDLSKHDVLCAQKQKLTKHLDFHLSLGVHISKVRSEEHGKFADESYKILNVRKDPSFVCPITLDVMKDPVIDITHGKSYDRKAIVKWIRDKGTSPLTGKRLNLRSLVPNRDLKDAIESYERCKSTINSEFLLLSKGVSVGVREVLLAAYKHSPSMQGCIKKYSSLKNFENKKCIPLFENTVDKLSKVSSEIHSCKNEIDAKKSTIGNLEKEKTKLGMFFKRFSDTEKTAKDAVNWMTFATGGLYVPTKENIPNTVVRYLMFIAGPHGYPVASSSQVLIQVARMKLGRKLGRSYTHGSEIAKKLEDIGLNPHGLMGGGTSHSTNTTTTAFSTWTRYTRHTRLEYHNMILKIVEDYKSGNKGGGTLYEHTTFPSPSSLSEIGYSLEDMKKIGFDYRVMLGAGFSKMNLMDAGWSHSELSGNPLPRSFRFNPTTDTDNRATETCFGSSSPGQMFVFGNRHRNRHEESLNDDDDDDDKV